MKLIGLIFVVSVRKKHKNDVTDTARGLRARSDKLLIGASDTVVISFISHARSRPSFVTGSRGLIYNTKNPQPPHLLET